MFLLLKDIPINSITSKLVILQWSLNVILELYMCVRKYNFILIMLISLSLKINKMLQTHLVSARKLCSCSQPKNVPHQQNTTKGYVLHIHGEIRPDKTIHKNYLCCCNKP